MTEEVRLAVVIPFYQREKGLLARAIGSVLAQDLPEGVAMTIVVVDDASPVPAAEEMRNTTVPAPHALHILRQENAGPGAARNTALDMLRGRGIRYAAFLDSDDEWRPGHLATAVAALEAGHDFYFCDHVRPGMNQRCFPDSPIMRAWRDGTRLPAPVRIGDDLFSLSAPAAFDALLEEYLSHTSTVVYRFDRHETVRFDPDLRSAGEDHMFWLTLLSGSDSAVYSLEANVVCGQGVNIFFSALDWKNPGAAARAGYLLVYRLKLRGFELSTRQASAVDAMIAEDGKTYAYLVFRNLLKGRAPNGHVLARVFRTSFADAIALPLQLVPMLFKQERERVARSQSGYGGT